MHENTRRQISAALQTYQNINLTQIYIIEYTTLSKTNVCVLNTSLVAFFLLFFQK